jgi:hypothetical protein
MTPLLDDRGSKDDDLEVMMFIDFGYRCHPKTQGTMTLTPPKKKNHTLQDIILKKSLYN